MRPILAGLALAVSVTVGHAAEFGTATEARAMLDRALLEMKSDPVAAIGKFNRADGGFRDRDLYVFCFFTANGLRTAHANKDLVGQDVRLLKEKDGSPIGQKIFDAVMASPPGQIATITYNFPRPGSDIPVAKETYATRIGDQACGVGFYK